MKFTANSLRTLTEEMHETSNRASNSMIKCHDIIYNVNIFFKTNRDYYLQCLFYSILIQCDNLIISLLSFKSTILLYFLGGGALS